MEPRAVGLFSFLGLVLSDISFKFKRELYELSVIDNESEHELFG